MKKQLFNLLLLIATSLTISCSKDEKESISTNLIGKWETLKKEEYDCPLAEDNRVLECGTYGFCYVIEFKPDNTFNINRSSTGDFLSSGTYSVYNSRIFLLHKYPYQRNEDYLLLISGHTITMTDPLGPDCKTRLTYRKLEV